MADNLQSKPEQPGSLHPAGSAELPPQDGYYWMHNIGSENQHIWRIIEIGFWADSGRGLKRAIRDGQRVYSMAYIAPWLGVEFHGPLLPPNDRTHRREAAAGDDQMQTCAATAASRSVQ